MRINALEDQDTGFNGDVDDNDEVAAYSFIFSVREIYMAFNEVKLKKIIGGFIMKTRRGLIFVWMKNGAWIDQNWQKLQSLCLQEAVDAEVEKPFVEAVLKEVSSNEVRFQIKSNSQYVFQYMLTQSIKKDIKKK